jgi:hypothetical protein
MLIRDKLTFHLQYGITHANIISLGIFKRLAVIGLELELPVGDSPPAHPISAAREILRASEYGGRKTIKVRVIRTRQSSDALQWGREYVGVENLDIIVV